MGHFAHVLNIVLHENRGFPQTKDGAQRISVSLPCRFNFTSHCGCVIFSQATHVCFSKGNRTEIRIHFGGSNLKNNYTQTKTWPQNSPPNPPPPTPPHPPPPTPPHPTPRTPPTPPPTTPPTHPLRPFQGPARRRLAATPSAPARRGASPAAAAQTTRLGTRFARPGFSTL